MTGFRFSAARRAAGFATCVVTGIATGIATGTVTGTVTGTATGIATGIATGTATGTVTGIATGAMLASAWISPVHAAPWRGFKALKFYVHDEIDESARVFTRKGQFLVAPGESEFVYLLVPKGYAAYRAAAAGAFDGDSPIIDSSDLTAWESLGMLEKSGPALSWSDDVGRYALSAKPPLLGATTLEDLRSYTDKYDLDIEEYTPDPDVVEQLASVTVPTEFVVGFGLWCSICAEWLPKFVKILEAVDNEHFTVTYISINEDLDRPAELLEEHRLDSVPTFVVRQYDAELGRIDTDSIELAGDPPMEDMLIDVFNRE